MSKLRLFGLFYLVPFAAYGVALAACSDGDSVILDDAGVDSPNSDTGTDPAEAGGDTGIDSGYDAGLKTDTFGEDLANAMCDSLSRCCFGAPTPDDGGVDGGTFNRGACLNFYRQFGFSGSNRGSEFRDGGRITLDQVKADDCLKRVKALTCDTPGTEFQAARTACFGAFTGTVAVGSGCADNIECAPGAYCRTADAGDGGMGTCTDLVPTGGNCGSTGDPTLAEQECSARQSGEPNHCAFYEFNTDTVLDPSEWVCVPPENVGGRCVTNTWCQNSLCDDNTFACVTPSNYFAPACANYVVP